MKPIAVTEKLSLAPQPNLSDFQDLREQGITTVINNRPDGEEPSQPGSAAEEAAARAAGLAYIHIPVRGAAMTEDDARRFKATIEQAPGRVLAHCRSGTRSFYLWALSGALDSHTDAELLAKATELGVDSSAARSWLTAHRNRLAGEQK